MKENDNYKILLEFHEMYLWCYIKASDGSSGVSQCVGGGGCTAWLDGSDALLLLSNTRSSVVEDSGTAMCLTTPPVAPRPPHPDGRVHYTSQDNPLPLWPRLLHLGHWPLPLAIGSHVSPSPDLHCATYSTTHVKHSLPGRRRRRHGLQPPSGGNVLKDANTRGLVWVWLHADCASDWSPHTSHGNKGAWG